MTASLSEGVMRLLTLTLDNVYFALDIHSVREILDMTDITSIPHTPEYMRGVVNVRGSAVPVVDLRLKFGLPAADRTLNTRIVILEIPRGDGVAAIGAIADSVREVLEVETARIDPPPRMGTGIRADFIRGICRQDERFLLILDAAKVFTTDEVLSLDELGAQPGPVVA
ncbi:chemotaxis protein CheW [Megalodesulfovibrio gigas]|uniref:Putative chemotaxis protein CheW n=1 Tax=Megalodesulfovibrio gigas (strain ATCC 19364 / DSM 1382 / NCIMB 9332 / VKM B-1759) TaxID=1121448 RepID=T2GF93_MEGG1|nr:chemotaxis protein CheW [Megalodesulfovibrio gigas]AGW14801.1 putative chemotaxis protein CheW [Megalodesulfovibrio gigas DSM 1382 = ATCC 19364]